MASLANTVGHAAGCERSASVYHFVVPTSTTRMFCKSCEYALAGLSGGICPECGRKFDSADASSFTGRRSAFRRRWARRVVWSASTLLVAWLLLPSRVTKLSWTWPNSDAVTATTETRWCLNAPSWLPIPYPRWSAGRSTQPIGAQRLQVFESAAWRIDRFSARSVGGVAMTIPMTQLPTGMRWVGWLGPISESAAGLDIVPENVDTLTEWIVSWRADKMSFSPHAIAADAKLKQARQTGP